MIEGRESLNAERLELRVSTISRAFVLEANRDVEGDDDLVPRSFELSPEALPEGFKAVHAQCSLGRRVRDPIRRSFGFGGGHEIQLLTIEGGWSRSRFQSISQEAWLKWCGDVVRLLNLL